MASVCLEMRPESGCSRFEWWEHDWECKLGTDDLES